MKQLLKLRNVATVFAFFAFFAVMAVAIIALSPKVFAATNISIGGNPLTANTTYGTSGNSVAGLTAGTVHWDGVDTLTLTNATITNYVKIEGNITIILKGTNSINASSSSAVSGVNGALHVTGDTKIQGTSRADTLTVSGGQIQDGIYIGASSDSTEMADKALTIETATIMATGGTSNAVRGRDGISCGSLTINNVTVEVTGGKTDAVSAKRAGGSGIYIGNGIISIEGSKITATGGDGNSYGGSSGGSGGKGIHISSVSTTPVFATILDTEINVTSGNATGEYTGEAGLSIDYNVYLTLERCIVNAKGGKADDRGGYGIYAVEDFTINNTTINSAVGGESNNKQGGYGIITNGTFTMTNSDIKTVMGGKSNSKGGDGIYAAQGFNMTNSTIGSATGGDSNTPTGYGGNGIFISNQNFELNNSSIDNAKGGSGNRTSTGAIASNGICFMSDISGKLILTNGSKIVANGGNASGGATNTAGHGVDGAVTLNDNSQLTANGGNASGGVTNTAGHGVDGAVTLTSSDIVLSAIGGTGDTSAHGLSQLLSINPSLINLKVFVGSSGFTTEVDPLDNTDPLYSNYFQNRYVHISKGVQPQTPQQTPPADVIYPAERTSTANGVYTFSSSGPYSNFTGVWVNGSAISSSNYTAAANADGGVSITFTNAYARTLNSSEEYLLHFVFNGGFGIVNFYKDVVAQATASTYDANSEATSQEETQGTDEGQAANSETEDTSNTDEQQAANSETQVASQPEEPTSSSAATDTTQVQGEGQAGNSMIILIAVLAIICIGSGVLIYVKARKNK